MYTITIKKMQQTERHELKKGICEAILRLIHSSSRYFIKTMLYPRGMLQFARSLFNKWPRDPAGSNIAFIKYQELVLGSSVQISLSICASSAFLVQRLAHNRLFVHTSAGFQRASGLNGASPHLALSVSPWPCQRPSWSSCSSLSTRLGL